MPVHTLAEATQLERAIRRFGSSRAGSWIFSRTLHHLDRLSTRLAPNRPVVTEVLAGLPVGMLTTTGAKSGKPRTVPLVVIPIERGWGVIASSFGNERNPGWYWNLRAHPRATLDVHGTTHAVLAELVSGAERDRIHAQAMAFYRGYAIYATRARHREIPIFALLPEAPPCAV
ncbi:MAG: nitroreductase family deazaflavin-dependent oxidoreductase [Tetrasphaera sp.]|nr:nitroreductase family deazaflavin-dependent oxidoreductase [Tetrasphaera sp.]